MFLSMLSPTITVNVQACDEPDADFSTPKRCRTADQGDTPDSVVKVN